MQSFIVLLNRKLCIHNVVFLALTFFFNCTYGALKGTKKITDAELVTENFKNLVVNGIFVDKSLLINETLKRDETVMQITRPRKWGKTLNLDMLKRFFEIEFDRNGNPLPECKKVNPVLFKGGAIKVGRKTLNLHPLKVSGLDDIMGHMGKHPVIYVNLKDVNGKNYNQFEEKLKYVVAELYLSYPFLKNFLDDGNDVLDVGEKIKLANFITGKIEDQDFISSFDFLSMLLYKHFQSEVFLFIDDYDIPIINAFLEFGDKNREFDSIVVMLRVLFENAFKENQYLLKGIITGTLNFFVVSSGISEYEYVCFNTVLNTPFSSFYGFTQKDIGELIGKANILFNSVQQLRQWYGGFYVNGVEIFNPWSIMKCLSKKGKFDYYLQQSYGTDFTRLINKAFISEDMLEYLHFLIEGREVIRSTLSESVYLRSVSGDFYSVFVHAGYLNSLPPPHSKDKPIWRLKIPNLDVRGIFAAGMGKWVANELNLKHAEYEHFINLLISKQVDRFGEELEELLTMNKCSDGTKELYYHNLICGIVSSLAMKYLVESVKEVGHNKGGNILIPFENYGNVAITIEYSIYKAMHDLDTTIEAVFEDLLNKTRIFTPKMNDHVHVKKMLYLAIGFCGHKVLVKHKIVNI